MKFFQKLLLFVTFFQLSIITCHAVSEFSTDFRSTYQVSGRGVTHVLHNIKITNNLTHIYTTEYSVQIGSSNLDNIKAQKDGAELPLKLDKTGNVTTIKIIIVHPEIGLGATTNLDLSYDTTDIAEKIGNNWEIDIPRLSRANEATFYSRKLIIPKSFGEPSTITPTPTSINEIDDSRIYEFIGYTRDSISLLFGKTVAYSINLQYHLKNPTLNTADTELAIPPDTPYQRIFINSLNPVPKSIKLDADGNWLAIYSLKSQEEKTVDISLVATVSPVPLYDLVMPLNPLTIKSESKYWQNSAPVTTVASKLSSAKDIYSYLVDNFVYDYRRVGKNERLGAESALDNPSSVICTEYTDSFIALARINKIPAVEINGYAYSDNSLKPAGSGDILHAWPAYFDQDTNSWRQIDPTWGSTTGGTDYFNKLDFNHIAFVIHGSESQYPIPAGAYKQNPDDVTIKVALTDQVPLANPSYEVSQKKDELIVTATGNAALHGQKIEYEGKSYLIDYLTPYGTQVFPLVSNTSLFTRLLTWIRSILN